MIEKIEIFSIMFLKCFPSTRVELNSVYFCFDLCRSISERYLLLDSLQSTDIVHNYYLLRKLQKQIYFTEQIGTLDLPLGAKQ